MGPLRHPVMLDSLAASLLAVLFVVEAVDAFAGVEALVEAPEAAWYAQAATANIRTTTSAMALFMLLPLRASAPGFPGTDNPGRSLFIHAGIPDVRRENRARIILPLYSGGIEELPS